MKKYKICEICTIKSSKRIYSSDYKNEGVPFFRGKEITEMSKNKPITELQYISEKKFKKINDKYGSPKKGDILMTAVGTLGNVWQVDREPIYFKDGNSIWFTDFNRDIVNPRYLMIYFQTAMFQKVLLSKGTIGSVQPAITMEKVNRLKVNLPSVEDQKKIVAEVNKIKSAIKLKSDLIVNFNEFEHLLFYKWFIDYNFPNESGMPYRNSGGKMLKLDDKEIPEGWNVVSLQDYITFNKGISYKSEEISAINDGIPMINLNSFNRKGGYKPEGIKYYEGKINEKKLLKPFDLVVACTDVTRNADIIGSPVLIPSLHGSKLLASCDVVQLEVKEPLNKYYVSSALKQNKYKRYIKGFANGTNVLHLDVKGISKFNVPLPPKGIIDQYSLILKTVEAKKSQLMNEIEVLREAHELMISKLIK